MPGPIRPGQRARQATSGRGRYDRRVLERPLVTHPVATWRGGPGPVPVLWGSWFVISIEGDGRQVVAGEVTLLQLEALQAAEHVQGARRRVEEAEEQLALRLSEEDGASGACCALQRRLGALEAQHAARKAPPPAAMAEGPTGPR
eukprot:Skav213764  [mRNA]  locus=scaffold3859:340776:345102:- [translate_table: standard]